MRRINQQQRQRRLQNERNARKTNEKKIVYIYSILGVSETRPNEALAFGLVYKSKWKFHFDARIKYKAHRKILWRA